MANTGLVMSEIARHRNEIKLQKKIGGSLQICVCEVTNLLLIFTCGFRGQTRPGKLASQHGSKFELQTNFLVVWIIAGLCVWKVAIGEWFVGKVVR